MTAPRLSDATLARADPLVLRPAYQRSETRIGVVHFGPGAFHRAHQAFYLDRMLARDPGLAICAVSLRSDDLRAALSPQDGLYALAECDAAPSLRVIGSIKQVLTAPRDPAAIFARLADPALRLITATVTEKGYCRTPAGDLDTADAGVLHDLTRPATPQTFPGWLVEGLRRRRAAGLGGLPVLSCDNLSGNGAALRRVATQFAQAAGDVDLARWIDGEIAFPDSMVDSITPATDDALRARATAQLGLVDAWPIQRERFVQWAVGDGLGPEADLFAECGVTVTPDIAGVERIKLRLLNAAHSTLAYVGLLSGYETVAEAMGDPALAGFVERMMRRDIAPLCPPAQGIDPQRYIGQVLDRFRNPAIAHRLSQIAWDGSQKLPIRILASIEDARRDGREPGGLWTAAAAWMAFVRTRAAAGADLIDPLAGDLTRIARAGGEAEAEVEGFLRLTGVFPPAWPGDEDIKRQLAQPYALLSSGDPGSALPRA